MMVAKASRHNLFLLRYPQLDTLLAGHVAKVLVVGVAIDLRLERVERGAEGLELVRLAVDLLGGPGLEVGSVVSGKEKVS